MARKKLRARRSKTTRSPKSRVSPDKNRTPQELVLPTAQPAKRLSPKNIFFIVLVLLMVSALGKIVLDKRNTPSKNTVEPQSNLADSNPKAAETLKEVYEKETGVSLGETFSPRYSIFENADFGYRFAYPVGFSYQWDGKSVEIIPKSNKGRITVTGENGTFDVKVDSSGVSEEEAEIVQSAADFIRQTFEFTNTTKSGTKERFNTSDGPVYKY